MRKSRLLIARQEAEKLIVRIDDVLDDGKSTGDSLYLCSPRLTGALRRQSLELTRALADMRKP